MTEQIIEVKIADIRIGERFRKDLGNLDELAGSISDDSLLQPIGITSDYDLVFGERRLLACRDVLKRETILARIIPIKSLLLGQIAENRFRKDYTPSELVAIVRTLRTFGHGGDRRSDQARNSGNEKLTTEEACALVGWSKDMFARAQNACDHGTPELREAMDREDLSVPAAGDMATLEPETQRALLAQKPHWTMKEIAKHQKRQALQQQEMLRKSVECPVVPLWSDDRLQVLCDDCLTAMRRLADGSAKATVTSPPYNQGIPYRSYLDDRPFDEYLAWLDEVFREIERVLTDDGSFFLNVGSSRKSPWTAARVAEVAGRHFVLQNEIIWVKSLTVDGRTHGHFTPIPGDRFLNHNFEHVYHFTKDGNARLDRLALGVPYEDQGNLRRNGAVTNLRCAGDVWFIPYETIQDAADKGFHPAPFPVELASRCIRLAGVGADELVLDPFAGTCTTLMACRQLGVRGIGVELDPGYCEWGRKRLAEGTTSLAKCA